MDYVIAWKHKSQTWDDEAVKKHMPEARFSDRKSADNELPRLEREYPNIDHRVEVRKHRGELTERAKG